VDGLDGVARNDGVPAARAALSGAGDGEADHLSPRLLALLGALTLAWGFNWTAMKLALAAVPPWTFRSICLGFGSAVLFLALHAGGQRLAVPRKQWRRLVLLAFLNITGWNIFIAYGLMMIASGRAAILAYTMPVLAVPLSLWLLRERLTRAKVAGLALGLSGLVLLVGESLGAAGAAPVGTLLEDFSWAHTVGLSALFGTVYNVLIAFAFAHWAWIKLATSLSVTAFSLSMLLIPVVGVFSGMLFLGERPSVVEYAALGLILASLATVAVPRRGAGG